jgi:hypothetical protein
MKHTIEEPEFVPYVTTCESELQYMAGLAEKRGKIETGGEVYGLFSHGGRPFVMFVTGPGPKAVHQIAHFQQDLEFLKKTNGLLREELGIQLIGNWHSHHSLGLSSLSHGDILANRSTAQRNNYRRQCQLLATFENESPAHDGYQRKRTRDVKVNHEKTEVRYSLPGNSIHDFKRQDEDRFQNNPEGGKKARVRIQGFFYPDAMKGKPVECPIKILAGVSPIRSAIQKHHGFSLLRTETLFPLSQISFERYDPPKHEDVITQLPARMADQFLDFPDPVLENMRCIVKEDFLIVSIPLHEKHYAIYIAYENRFPHNPKYIYLDEDQTDIKEGSFAKKNLGKLSCCTRTVIDFVNKTLSMIL